MTLFNNALYVSIIDYDFFFSGSSEGQEEWGKLFYVNLNYHKNFFNIYPLLNVSFLFTNLVLTVIVLSAILAVSYS